MFFIAQCSIALFWFKGEFAGVNKRTRIIKNPSGSRNLNLDKIIPKCIRLLSIIQSKNNTQLNLHREENCYRKQKYDFRIPLSFTPFFPPLHFPVLEAEIPGGNSSSCSLAKDFFIDTATLFIYLIVKKSCLYLSANQIMCKQNMILNLKTGKIQGKKCQVLRKQKRSIAYINLQSYTKGQRI